MMTSEQIQLYEPDIILTGGWGLVSNILHDEILADDAEWVKPNGQTALWYYTLDIRARKDSARDWTIIKTARNI